MPVKIEPVPLVLAGSGRRQNIRNFLSGPGHSLFQSRRQFGTHLGESRISEQVMALMRIRNSGNARRIS
jgi:hypothetical protein